MVQVSNLNPLDSPHYLLRPESSTLSLKNRLCLEMTGEAPDSDTSSHQEQKDCTNSFPPTVRRSEVLWFDDGNIILIAQEVAFKVHRSFLSCSDLFRDMFAVAQPDTSDCTTPPFGDLPTIALSDTANDLTIFLNIIYYAGRDPYYRLSDVPAPIEWVSTLLRLGRKYQVDFVSEEAIRRLRAVCPSPYERPFIEVEGKKDLITDYVGGGMAITIVRFAHAFDLPELLPIALYRCCQLPLKMLVYGFTLPDGTLEQLSPDDVLRCLHGRIQFLDLNYTLSKAMHSSEPILSCEKCYKNVHLSKQALLDHDILNNHFDRFYAGMTPCPGCLDNYFVGVRRIHDKAFVSLPSIFGLV